jgi:hypothetical protein
MDAVCEKRSLSERLRWIAIFFLSVRPSDPQALLDEFLQWFAPGNIVGIDRRRQYALRRIEMILRYNGVSPEEGSFGSACESIGLTAPLDFVVTKEMMIQVSSLQYIHISI